MTLNIMATAKLSKEPDVDRDFMADPRVPQEEKDKELANAPIRILEVLKHFPYHNEDKTIWVDKEFGKELGYDKIEPSEFQNLREECQDWPDVSQMVRIPGKGFFREVAMCSTVAQANAVKDKIMELDKIEEVTKDRRYYAETIKKVAKVVGK